MNMCSEALGMLNLTFWRLAPQRHQKGVMRIEYAMQIRFKHSRGLGFRCQVAGGYSETFRMAPKRPGVFRSPFRTIPNHSEPFRTVPKPFRTVQNRFEPFGTVPNRSEPSPAVPNRSEPSRNRSETVPKPFRTVPSRPVQSPCPVRSVDRAFACPVLYRRAPKTSQDSPSPSQGSYTGSYKGSKRALGFRVYSKHPMR